MLVRSSHPARDGKQNAKQSHSPRLFYWNGYHTSINPYTGLLLMALRNLGVEGDTTNVLPTRIVYWPTSG